MNHKKPRSFIRKLKLAIPRSETPTKGSPSLDLDVSAVDILQFEKGGETYTFRSDKFEKHFEEIRELSGGNGYADVRVYMHTKSNRRLVIKSIPLKWSMHDVNEAQELKNLKREIKVHRTSDESPNITKFFGVCVYDGHALICMELMTTSLSGFYKHVHRKEGFLSDQVLGNITVSILDALAWCKSKGIMHRDIKPPNILVNKEGYVKLCDFGLARELDHSCASTYCGTFVYMAPERIQNPNQKYDIRSDIWSFGMTIAEVAFGKFPLDVNGADDFKILREIKDIKSDQVNALVDRCFMLCSEESKDFATLCFQELEFRPNIDGLLETEFYKMHKVSHRLGVIETYMEDFNDE